MIDVQGLDYEEGLYAVFMDEEGIDALVNALVWADDESPLPKELQTLCMEMEEAQEWRETRLETMALES